MPKVVPRLSGRWGPCGYPPLWANSSFGCVQTKKSRFKAYGSRPDSLVFEGYAILLTGASVLVGIIANRLMPPRLVVLQCAPGSRRQSRLPPRRRYARAKRIAGNHLPSSWRRWLTDPSPSDALLPAFLAGPYCETDCACFTLQNGSIDSRWLPMV